MYGWEDKEETISKQLNSEDIERPTYELNIEADSGDEEIPNCCHMLPYSLCDKIFILKRRKVLIFQDMNPQLDSSDLDSIKKYVNFLMAMRYKIVATVINEDGSTPLLCIRETFKIIHEFEAIPYFDIMNIDCYLEKPNNTITIVIDAVQSWPEADFGSNKVEDGWGITSYVKNQSDTLRTPLLFGIECKFYLRKGVIEIASLCQLVIPSLGGGCWRRCWAPRSMSVAIVQQLANWINILNSGAGDEEREEVLDQLEDLLDKIPRGRLHCVPHSRLHCLHKRVHRYSTATTKERATCMIQNIIQQQISPSIYE